MFEDNLEPTLSTEGQEDPGSTMDLPDEGKLKKILSLVGVILILGSVALYAFYTSSLSDEYDDAKVSIETKTDEAEVLSARIDVLKEAEGKMGLETEVQKKTLLDSIPVGLNQDDVIEDLVDIAASNDVVLHSVSFGKVKDLYEGVSALQISASFEGNYNDLIHFLKGIEGNARLFKVSSINVQVNYLEELDLNRVSFSLSMNAYYQN
ncbi:hypothetical protein HOE67_03730 [Candidatus Peregrinibacteria bacterium]|jgi:Tfp pilus assembly protein PilO|nr:hypothetical protein [Candidatus Peregrinibacteria bacterium]MBT4056196.1 hypothetical protein [Candidatus Peregrinibacteria bacterium]